VDAGNLNNLKYKSAPDEQLHDSVDTKASEQSDAEGADDKQTKIKIRFAVEEDREAVRSLARWQHE